MARTILTVSQLNFYLKSKVEEDANIRQVLIRGEVSNFVNHYKSGHFYFTLKDDKCAIRCVMFRSYAQRIKFDLENGMAVLVIGSTIVYERDGSFQIRVFDVQPDGLGAKFLALQQLKAKLEAEGLFEQERKRPIPQLPKAVGVISAKTGAAVRDIINTTKGRNPMVKLVLAPVLVQGEAAPKSIIEAIRYFDRGDAVDTVLIARGGGASEDLSAFNDEGVVRAIAACHLPVISAVGHETDFTLADFVSDARASTPTLGAVMAMADLSAVRAQVSSSFEKIIHSHQNLCYNYTQMLDALSSSPYLRSPKGYVEQNLLRLGELRRRLTQGWAGQQKALERRLGENAGKLDALSPLKVLSRGYSLAYKGEELVRASSQLKENDRVALQFHEGRAEATITQILQDEGEAPIGGDR